MFPLLLGLIVTLAGAAYVARVLFGHRGLPVLRDVVIEGVTMSPAKVILARREPDPGPDMFSGSGIRITKLVRLRAVLGLLVFTLGTAAMLATIVGVAVLAIGVLIQH